MGFFRRKPDAEDAHLLADHLEAVLGLADEMRALFYTPHATTSEASAQAILDDLARLSAFVERLHSIELAIAAKIGHARRMADRLARADARLATFASLFSSGTACLGEALPRLSESSERAFNHSDQAINFLRTRGIIPRDKASLEGLASLRPEEGYLLLSVVALGAVVGLTESCLNALDAHFGIYEAEGDGVPAAPAAGGALDAPAPSPAPAEAASEPLPGRLTDRLKRIIG